MSRFRIVILLALCLLGISCAREGEVQVAASPSAPTIVVDIEGELNIAQQARLAKAIREAQDVEGSWVIVSIDTPGGDIETMGAMGLALREASTSKRRVTTVAYVAGGKFGGAWSAGSFLALACEKIYMKEGTSIGAALPVVPALLPTGFGLAAADKFASGKIIGMLAARFKEYARETGRSEGVAAAFVDPTLGVYKVRLGDGRESVYSSDEVNRARSEGKSISILKEYQPEQSDRPLVLSSRDAFDCGLSQGTVKDMDDLVATIGRNSAELRRIEPFPGETLVEWINLATPVLLLLGIVLGFLEAKIPGFGLAGTLSVLCFGLVFYGRYLLGAAEIIHGIFFVLGLLLIAVEIFVAPGTFYAAVLGILCIALSLFLAFQHFIIPRDSLDVAILVQNLTWASGIFLASALIMFVMSKYLPAAPVVRGMVLPVPTGQDGSGAGALSDAPLVGRTALAGSDLRPSGVILLDGRRLDAMTEGSYIPKDSIVRILDVSANRIVVIPEPPNSAPGSTSA
jgi:membrane-bound serine protease (ClpP class)